MRIRGWSIDGFGIFSHYEIRDLPEGLVVFYGPNEAGKTTLLAFLRGLLFGFPGGRNGAPAYPPVHGGPYGGRGLLVGPDGEYTVVRSGKNGTAFRITRPDGEPGTADDLQRVLGGIDEALFESVFAFSLAELSALASLDIEAIRERIFSASIAGAGRSARLVLRQLEAQAAGLLAEDGKARINALVDELNQLRLRRDAARRAAIAYVEHVAEERKGAAEIARLRAELAEHRAARLRAETVMALWPIWAELAQARRDLEVLEPIDVFPAGADVKLAVAREQLASAREALQALRREQEQAVRQLSERRRATGADVAPEITRLHRELLTHRTHAVELSVARARCQTAERAVSERLRQLGAGWDAARVAGCDASAAARAVVRAWESRLGAAAETERRARAELESAARQRDRVQREHQQVASELSAAPAPPAAMVAEQREALRRLRANLEQVALDQAQGESSDRVVKDRERALRALESEIAASPPLWLGGMLWLVLGLGTLAVVWRAVQGDFFGAGVAAIVSLGAGVAAFTVDQLRRSVLARERQREAACRARRSELHEARRAREAHWRRAAERLEAIAQDAALLGLPRLPSLPAVEERDQELTRLEHECARSDVQRAHLDDLARALQRAEEDLRVATQRATEVREMAQRLQQEWTAWKTEAQLPVALSPADAADFLVMVREAQTAVEARERERNEIERLEQAVAAWERQARAALGPVQGVGDLTGEELIDRLSAAYVQCAQDEEARWALASLEGEVRVRAQQIADAEAAIRRWESVCDDVLRAAGAADERDFERRRAIFSRRRELQRTIEEREQELGARIGSGAEADAIRSALSTAQPDQWKRHMDETETQLQEIEHRLLEAVERHHDLKQICQALEESAEVPALEVEWNGLMAELAAAVRQWRVLAVARGLVEETLREFERTRQPAVLVEASRMFSVVTGGRYRRVLQDESGRALIVVDRDGQRKRVPDELSRGTTEQLYLCLRLGLASDFARRGTALPVIMDDVLVNFDPARAQAMATALGRFARRHQVLFFTCHPATSSVLAEAGNAARVIEI